MHKTLVAIAAVLLVSGCGVSRVAGSDAPPRPREGPTREQVLQANSLCSAEAQLATELAEGRELLDGQDEYSLGPDHYLTFVASTVTSLADGLDAISDAGIEEADRYVATFAAELARIAPEVTRLAGESWEVHQLPPAQQLDRVRKIVAQFESIETDGDLRTLVRDVPAFAWAYDLAPGCEPLAPPSSSRSTAPPPENVPASEAEDGTDLAACEDGTCEVAITGSATVTAGAFTLAVTVADGQATIAHDYGGGGSGRSTLGGVGAVSSFGSGGRTVTITARGLDGGTAVLKFEVS